MMASCEEKYEIEIDDMNLPLIKAEIKFEGDTEVIGGTDVQDVLTPVPNSAFEIEGIPFLTLKAEQREVKSEEAAEISVTSLSRSHVPEMGKVNTFTFPGGKCPGCRRPFVLNLSGFDDVARHIFYSHKKNYRQYLFILRMVYGCPHSFAMDQRRFKGSKNRAANPF